MRKIEAEQLIGKQVRVWTAANGVYVGTLEVASGSPWRGMVSITGVVEPAHHFDHGTICRRGFRPGEVLEAGGACIKETTESGHPTYLEAVQAQINFYMGSHSGYQTSTHRWVHEAMARALRAVMLAEERRLASGTWKLIQSEGEACHLRLATI